MRTLADCFELLNLRDKATLALIVTLNSDPKLEVEVATLPFVKVSVALEALNYAVASSVAFRRYYSQIREEVKMALRVNTPGTTQHIRYLDDAKVVRRLGLHPERGFLLKGIALKQTAGVKPGQFGRGVDQVEVDVSPLVTLTPAGRQRWIMTVNERYIEAADRFLSDNLM